MRRGALAAPDAGIGTRRERSVGLTVRSMTVGALAVALGACGAGSAGPDAPRARSVVDGTVGRMCRYVMPPDATPTFAELTRLGTRGNVALWGREMGPADSVELSVRYGDDGRIQWVEAIRSTVSPERLGPLQRLVFEALDEEGPADWGVRLLVVAGDVAAVLPSVTCDPERSAGAGVWANPPSNPAAVRDFYLVRGRRVSVRVALDERGRVQDVRLRESTYSRWVDQYILDYVRNSSFEPKLHDGLGVATVFEIQLQFPRR